VRILATSHPVSVVPEGPALQNRREEPGA
jgi:hypothetical protein